MAFELHERRTRPRIRREQWLNGLFILPYLLLLSVWFVLPALGGFGISLTEWNVFTGQVDFVGFRNYAHIFKDDLFLKSTVNTLLYAFLTVTLGNLFSFILAYGLARGGRTKVLFQTIFFMPVVFSIGVTGIVWGWLYNADFGILNYWLQQLGAPRINFLTNPRYAMLAIVIMVIWAGAGFNMLIYLTGLMNVPTTFYEAAEIDGADAWQKLRHITLPLMRYTFAFTLTVSIIGALQVFDQPYILTGGGPDYATYTYIFHLYSNAFRYFRMGYASALAYLLAAVIFVLSLIQYRLLTRNAVTY